MAGENSKPDPDQFKYDINIVYSGSSEPPQISDLREHLSEVHNLTTYGETDHMLGGNKFDNFHEGVHISR